jgi:hypothetical protein
MGLFERTNSRHKALSDLSGFVCGTVVDDQNFNGSVALCQHAFNGFRQIPFAVVNRYNDTDQWVDELNRFTLRD